LEKILVAREYGKGEHGGGDIPTKAASSTTTTTQWFSELELAGLWAALHDDAAALVPHDEAPPGDAAAHNVDDHDVPDDVAAAGAPNPDEALAFEEDAAPADALNPFLEAPPQEAAAPHEDAQLLPGNAEVAAPLEDDEAAGKAAAAAALNHPSCLASYVGFMPPRYEPIEPPLYPHFHAGIVIG
jgi:hypothetical protein